MVSDSVLNFIKFYSAWILKKEEYIEIPAEVL